MTGGPTVFIVDDERPVRRALGAMLQAAGFCVTTCCGADEFFAAHDPACPACLVLDVEMPGVDGIELQRQLNERGMRIPLIFLTGHGDVPKAVAAIQDGAVDFLEKPADPAILKSKVRAALEGAAAAFADDRERAEVEANLCRLTPRERQVLDCLIQGKTTRATAQALGTQPATVRVQRASIYRKMQADSSTDLLRMMTLLDGG